MIAFLETRSLRRARRFPPDPEPTDMPRSKPSPSIESPAVAHTDGGEVTDSVRPGTSGPEAWIVAIDRLHHSLASRDPLQTASIFAEGVAEAIGGVAVVIEMIAPSGQRLVVSHGAPGGFIESIAPMLSPDRLGRPSPRIDVMDDIDAAGEFAGTLLHESLRRAGVRGWFSMALTSDGQRSFGTLVVFVRDGMHVGEGIRNIVRIQMQRFALALEQIWLGESARASDLRLGAVLDSLPDGVAIVAPDGSVVSVNHAAAQLLGLSVESVAGRRFDELFGIEAGTLGPYELLARGGDGAQSCLEFSSRSIEGGRGTVVTIRDVTHSRAAEARLRESDRLAMIGTIAAGLGHDMNNVLLPVRAHLNVLASAGRRLGAEQRSTHVSQIRASLSYLQHLADSLHGLAIDPDADGEGMGCTLLAEWWRKSRPILEKTLHRRAQLDCFIDESIPEVAAPAHALTRALLNLLLNAGEAMPSDRAHSGCRVVVRIRALDDAASIEVTDNGAGMSEEVRRRAFDMFFTTKTRGLGTGLGLPLVRRVVERAGGRIEIDSRVGLGTTVRMILPFVRPEANPTRLTGLIRLEDGRCAAILRGYLTFFGVDLVEGGSPADADMLVTDAVHTTLNDAVRWSTTHEPGLLVLVGEPSDADELCVVGWSYEDDCVVND